MIELPQPQDNGWSWGNNKLSIQWLTKPSEPPELLQLDNTANAKWANVLAADAAAIKKRWNAHPSACENVVITVLMMRRPEVSEWMTPYRLIHYKKLIAIKFYWYILTHTEFFCYCCMFLGTCGRLAAADCCCNCSRLAAADSNLKLILVILVTSYKKTQYSNLKCIGYFA